MLNQPETDILDGMKIRDLSGQKFGSLTAIKRLGTIVTGKQGKQKRSLWLFECACGHRIERVLSTIYREQSCGCVSRQNTIERNTKHGQAKRGSLTRTYNTWRSIKDRCLNPKFHKYPSYGGLGIKICDRWIDSFANFFADMGECPKGMTIERINNTGNYTPKNCKWATPREQAQNRRSSRFVSYNGQTKVVAEWARTLQISSATLLYWLDKGFSMSEIEKKAKHLREVSNE